MNFFEEEATSRRAALRKKARAYRDGMPEAARLAASRVICANFLNLPETTRAGSFFVYAAFRSEVETAELIAALQARRKIVCVPLVARATPPVACGDSPLKEGALDMLAICMDGEAHALAPGFHGIPEPAFHPNRVFPPGELDVVVLPGLLFDRNGNRLGYGGGFYDRFLANQAPQALRVGLAFTCQITDADIPAEPHDMRLDMLVTEAEILRFPG